MSYVKKLLKQIEKNTAEAKIKYGILPKKEVMKLRPGTWIEVWYSDIPPNVVLLLKKPENKKGDVCLKCFDPNYGYLVSNIVHSQVIGVAGKMEVPVALNRESLYEDEANAA